MNLNLINRAPIARLILTALLFGWMSNIQAQPVSLDHPVYAEGLIFFPSIKNRKQFYYVPNQLSLARDENDHPIFSFIQWEPSEEFKTEGGGIVHANILLEVPKALLTKAAEKLAEKVPGAKIQGPIVYQEGNFQLISAFKDESGRLAKRVVGLGKAPVLEGSKMAFSLELTKVGAEILWESFSMETPDISFSIEMVMSGFRTPEEAILEVDFNKVYEHKLFNASLATPFFAGEIKKAYDQLFNNGVIKFTRIGTEGEVGKLAEQAYQKLLDMMFEPLPTNDGTKNQASPALLDKAQTMLKEARAETQAMNKDKKEKDKTTLPFFSGMAVYKLKKIQHKGTFRFDYNQYREEKQIVRFDQNIGSLSAYKQDNRFFRKMVLGAGNEMLKGRNIALQLDTDIQAGTFQTHINYVGVYLEKHHENGNKSSDFVLLNASNFDELQHNLVLKYDWKQDKDWAHWLRYRYKVVWNLKGGMEYVQDWAESEEAVLHLKPPLRLVSLTIIGLEDELKGQNIQASTLILYAEGPDQAKNPVRISLAYWKGEFEKQLHFSIPPDEDHYYYKIIHVYPTGEHPSAILSGSSNFIFIGAY